jgi:dTDP-4-dehydrorhamnose reductase
MGIVRTAWLYGPPGNDFPAKILAAAERARTSGAPLKVVSDEVGSPTFSHDVAEAIAELLGSGDVGGLHHVVNTGFTSRADWARELFRQAGAAVEIEEVPAATWPRASTPPAWAVLEPTPLPGGEPLRSWQAALADYTPTLLRATRAAR